MEPKYKIWGEGRVEDWGGAGVHLHTWSTQAAPEVQAEQPQVAALRGCPMPLSPLSYTSFKLHFHPCSCQGPARVPHSHVTKAKRGWFSCPGVTGFVTHKVLDLSSLTIPAGHRPAPIQVSCKGCPRAQDSLISAAVSVNERKEPSGHYGLLKGW